MITVITVITVIRLATLTAALSLWSFQGLSQIENPQTDNKNPSESCKGFHFMIIEGTGESGGTTEKSFRDLTTSWSQAYGKFADSVTIVPPPKKVTSVKEDDPNSPTLKRLISELEKPADQLCTPQTGALFTKYSNAGEQFMRVRNISANEANDYKLGEISPKTSIEHKDVTRPNAVPSMEIVKKIREAKARCGDQGEQVAMVTIKDHGASHCALALTAEKLLSAQDMVKNIVLPLQKAGARVMLNLDSCYSGCFVDKLQAMNLKNVCLSSTTRANTVGYGSDTLIGGTYDLTFPQFLKKSGNTLVAHICAALHDPLNEPKMTTSKPAEDPIGASSGNLEERRKSIISRLEQKFGLQNLESICGTQLGSNATRVLNESAVKKMYSCSYVQKGFSEMLGAAETKAFFSHVKNPDSSPGVVALNKLLAEDKGEILKNCNYQFPMANSERRQPTGGSLSKADDVHGGQK